MDDLILTISDLFPKKESRNVSTLSISNLFPK